MDRRMIKVDGATLEVFVGGADGAAGPTVCQSHPFVAQTADGGLLDIVGDRCRVVRVNPRGVGNSSAGRKPQEYSFAQHIADLETVRQRLDVDRWVFHGEEGGGCVGLLYALQDLPSLSGLVVAWMGTSGRRIAGDRRSILGPEHPAYRADLQPATLTQPLRRHRAALDPFGGAPAAWLEVRPDVWVLTRAGLPILMRPGFGALGERAEPSLEEFVSVFDVQDRLEHIDVPTLVVAAGQDPIVPLDEYERLRAGLRHAEFVLLEASGHGEGSLSGDDAGAYRSALRRFLASIR
jgi:proline iminopeptidase